MVVDIPQCTLLSEVIFYHIMKFFLLVKILSFGLNSSGIKSVCSIYVGSLLNSVYIFMEHD